MDSTVQRAAETLAAPAGARLRDYLARRGVTEATARRWRLGYQPAPVEVTTADGQQPRVATGLLIPWYSGGDLWQVKLRRLGLTHAGARGPALPGGARRPAVNASCSQRRAPSLSRRSAAR